MSKGWRKVAWAAGVLVTLTVAQVLGFCWIPGFDVLLWLGFGWIAYLARVGPQIDVRWDLVASTLAYAVALVAGSHWFLRWLYRELRKRGEGGGDTAASPGAPGWRWRWTLGAFAILFLMFAAGTAAVGITHQTAWLVRSPEPLYRPYGAGGVRARVRCATNLRHIGQALLLYAESHGGQFPDDLDVLITDGHLEYPDMLTCPADQNAWAGGPGGDVHGDRHISYFYFGKGLSTSARDDRVIAVESLEHHEGEGINVLYAGGDVERVNAAEAERLLLSLGFERVEAPPRR